MREIASLLGLGEVASVSINFGDLEETTYMRQPEGYVSKKYPYHVSLLTNALYDLK